MSLPFSALALLIAASDPAPPANAPVAVARALVEALASGPQDRFPPGAELAIWVDPESAAQPLLRDVLAALPGPLETLGARVGAPAAGVDEARRGGAEWLLRLRFEPDGEGRLVGRLEEIDRGPFEPLAPRLVARADVLLGRPLGTSPSPIADGSSADAPSALLGRPLTVLRWPRPIWALASCPDRDGRDRVIIAEEDAVHLVDLQRPRSPRTLSLTAETPAEEPVRAPFAVLRCGPPGRVGLGHGRLDQGVELAFGPQRIDVRSRLEGWPVGYVDGGWWRARPDEGRRRFGLPLVRADETAVTLEAPLPELAVTPSGRLFGVDEGLELRPLTSSGAFGLPLSRAGVGLAVREIEGETIVAVTGPESSPDALLIHRGASQARRTVPGRAVATALGRPGGRWVALVAVADRSARHRLVAVPIGASR